MEVSEEFKEKFLFIYPSFIKLFFGILIGYSFIHWLIFIELDLYSIKDHVLYLLVPIILGIIGLVFYIKPKLSILNLNINHRNRKGLYYILFGIALIIPNVITQLLLVSSTGTLSTIESINDLFENSTSRYFKVNQFDLNLNNISHNLESSISGRYFYQLDMSLYLVAPIYKELKDTSSTNPIAWLGVNYNKSIKNSLESAKKREIIENFILNSRINFKLKDFSSVVYYEKLNNSSLRDNYYKALNKNFKKEGTQIVLIPKYDVFESRNDGLAIWLIFSILIVLTGVIVLIHYPEINRTKKRKYKFNLVEEITLLKEFILPEEGTKITYYLILVNSIIFFSMTISGLGFIAFKSSDLILWGANDGFSISHGSYWRLLTSVFLHGGLMHLASNMLTLYLIGNFLEIKMGKTLFLISYLVTGIIASLTSFFWNVSVISVGASGAIFGLLGIWIIFLIRNVFQKGLKYEQLKMISIIVLLNLLFGLNDGIDNAAHIGGLISGLILGFVLLTDIRKRIKK